MSRVERTPTVKERTTAPVMAVATTLSQSNGRPLATQNALEEQGEGGLPVSALHDGVCVMLIVVVAARIYLRLVQYDPDDPRLNANEPIQCGLCAFPTGRP
jgi:hypothetical protein